MEDSINYSEVVKFITKQADSFYKAAADENIEDFDTIAKAAMLAATNVTAIAFCKKYNLDMQDAQKFKIAYEIGKYAFIVFADTFKKELEAGFDNSLLEEFENLKNYLLNTKV